MADNRGAATIHHQLRELLLRPEFYPECVEEVELRETHISLVYLADRYVYKLKKPVKMDFLDFRSAAQRRQACEEELRLNRRLAADVYLGLVPVLQDSDGVLTLGDLWQPGDPPVDGVEWLVKMRRLDDADTLRARLEADSVTPQQVRAISSALGDFFTAQSPADISGPEHVLRLDEHIRANRAILSEAGETLNAQQVSRIHTGQLLYLHTRRRLFCDRVADGRVIDAHGDLRPDHVYVIESEGRIQTVFLDCIEFSREFRMNDCLDEVCFLAMECEHRGRRDVAEQLERQYEEGQRDAGESIRCGLMPFYRSYRACVRAKVDVLRAAQQSGEWRQHSLRDAQTYLDIAERAIHSRPLLLIVRGASGTGKSTVAAAVAERLACVRLQTDQIRQQRAQGAASGADQQGHNQGRYSLGQRLHVYEAMFNAAQARLQRGQSVILDATFLTHPLQQAALDLAARESAKAWIVNCTCPVATAQHRIAHRIGCGGASFSEAQVDTHVRQLAEQQLPPASMPQQTVDTTSPVSDLVEQIMDHLPNLWSETDDIIDHRDSD